MVCSKSHKSSPQRYLVDGCIIQWRPAKNEQGQHFIYMYTTTVYQCEEYAVLSTRRNLFLKTPRP